MTGLLSAGAMGFWHGVEYYEKERRIGEEFYQEWNNVSIYTFKHYTVHFESSQVKSSFES